MIRKPCVAGQFYPADPGSLKAELDGFVYPGAEKEKVVAVIAPHAGYMYSGHVAGAAYSAIEVPDNVILIGPNHTGYGRKASVMTAGRWETPMGDVEINAPLAEMLLKSSPLFSNDSTAHIAEHSLEVQLPFLLTVNSRVSIVPVTVMHASREECALMGAAIAETVAAYGADVLIAVSSDMNHYEDDTSTRAKDKLAIDRVLALDADGLLEVTGKEDISMCGVIPSAVAISAALKLGAKSARLVKYATSGDTSGDYTHVVGYAGIIIK